MSTDLESLMDCCKQFQAVGPANTNERSPNWLLSSEQLNRLGYQIEIQFDLQWLPSGCKIPQGRTGTSHGATYTPEGRKVILRYTQPV